MASVSFVNRSASQLSSRPATGAALQSQHTSMAAFLDSLNQRGTAAPPVDSTLAEAVRELEPLQPPRPLSIADLDSQRILHEASTRPGAKPESLNPYDDEVMVRKAS